MAKRDSIERQKNFWAAPGGERGAIMVIVVMFIMIFLILGVGLYWLIASQTRATETERTDVKSFNVAEAGVDAGMLALKLTWPSSSSSSVVVDAALLKETLQNDNPALWDPSRSDASEFLQVEVYDNSTISGETVTVPPDVDQRVYWDANVMDDGTIGDGIMFVDASSNVDDDRHRILIMAERQGWEFAFPRGLALYSNEVASNGQGFGIEIENGSGPVYYQVHDALGKGINPGDGVSTLPSAEYEDEDKVQDFDSFFTPDLSKAAEILAKQQGSYFTDSLSAQTYLNSGKANGKVVYIKSPTGVTITGSKQIGTVAAPVVVVIDTPDGSTNTWDMKGSADLYGVLVTVGDSALYGTCSIHGALYCSGSLLNKGTGNTAELNYNDQVLINIKRQYVISVNVVPNTWEEYTVQ